LLLLIPTLAFRPSLSKSSNFTGPRAEPPFGPHQVPHCPACEHGKGWKTSPFQADTIIQTPKHLEPSLKIARVLLLLTAAALAVCFSLQVYMRPATLRRMDVARPGEHLDLDASLAVCGVGRYQWTIMLAILLAWVADAAEDALLHCMAPQLVDSLDADELSVADLRIFSHMAMACSAFLGGSFADSFGRRPVFCLSCWMAAIFSLLSTLCTEFWAFCLCRVLAGMGLGALVGADVALLCEFLPVTKREQVIPLLYVGIVMGQLYANFCAFVIFPMFGTWRAPFLLLSLPLLLSGCVRLWLHESPYSLLARGLDAHAKQALTDVAEMNRGRRSTTCLIKGGHLPKKYQGMDFRNCLTAGVSATVRENQLDKVLAVAALAVALGFGRLLDSLAPEIQAHFSLYGLSTVAASAALISCLWCLLTAFLIHNGFLAWDVFIVGCMAAQGVLMCTSIVWQSESPAWRSSCFLLAAWAAAEGATSASLFAIAVRVFPEQARATSIGIVDAVSRSVVALQPFLAADLLSSLGTSLGAAALGMCWLLAGVLALALRRLWEAPQVQEADASSPKALA